MGFPPHKKGRQTFITKIFESEYPVVVYESKHRIIKFLDELDNYNKDIVKQNEADAEEITNYKLQITNKYKNSKLKKESREKKLAPVTSVVVARELSKMHETTYRGDIKIIKERIQENKDDQKGEFVVVIGK
jgi:16S rRNA (cytidine1402-2'-O)-methyltransferase